MLKCAGVEAPDSEGAAVCLTSLQLSYSLILERIFLLPTLHLSEFSYFVHFKGVIYFGFVSVLVLA